MDETEMAIRLGVATAGGLILGLDRELRGISAGLRTHALVALSSALITVSALLLFEQLRLAGTDADPLRVIQGLAQAIGFIAAGTIFVYKGDVRHLTSAANIWLAAAMGIAAGAGQFVLAGMGVAFGLVIITVLGVIEHLLRRDSKRNATATPKESEAGATGQQARAVPPE